MQRKTNHHENAIEGYIDSQIISALYRHLEPTLISIIDGVFESKYATKFQEDPIDIHEAAKIINRSVDTVYGYCSRNEIPFHKVPGKGKGKNSFFKSELLNWLKEGRKSQTP